jgi:hypothetical protein
MDLKDRSCDCLAALFIAHCLLSISKHWGLRVKGTGEAMLLIAARTKVDAFHSMFITTSTSLSLKDPTVERSRPLSRDRQRRRRYFKFKSSPCYMKVLPWMTNAQALEAARQKGDSIKDEIWAELAACNYELWQVWIRVCLLMCTSLCLCVHMSSSSAWK